jgi:predicted O-methyltransferase YrrM
MSLRLKLAAKIDRLRWRLPDAWRDAPALGDLRDRLIAAHWLAPAQRQRLVSRAATCRSPGDWFDFATTFLPPHQIRAEIVGFLEFAARIRPQTVVEIGTASGGTNFLLGAALPDVTLKLGLDLFVQNKRLLRAYGRPECRHIFLDGSSRAPETLARVRAALGDRPIDVLFIDGDHSYAGVQADHELYGPLVRPGGLIAFHDIVPDYRTRFGRDTGRYAGDVPRYWQLARERFARVQEFIADPGQDGLGIGVGVTPDQ